ncbi:armadillo repeat-containing protein 6-like [Melia azedarach]|uniref:Armadillo repeat-containing protein 6-like n=1 Tax=Melia azedarach TaxID=155640 RepID=A0ACC1Y097_MELAZ|nr:armadillo repeat-containing protein 6-like [Melia azedarach]
MGPPKTVRTISQEAFDEVVKENVEDLGMDPAEALEDAIQTLTLQGVDLSGIVKCVPGESSVKDNPLIQSLDVLKQLDNNSKDQFSDKDLNELFGLFDKLVELFHDVQSTETFRRIGGPTVLVNILKDGFEDLEILNSGFAVVAASAAGNEVVKESYMELKIDELILEILNRQRNDNIQSLYDAIRALLTPDDNRVVASQVYGYARRFAKIGIARALVRSVHAGLNSPSLISASIALKAVVVNDEICKSIAESGGIDAVLQCIDDSAEQGNKTVARTCCSLLSKLAGSDSNKSSIVEKGGMDRLIKFSARFSDDASVLQEVMSIITVLSLRSPENAAFRNPENRTLLLSNGIEKLIRQAKENHESCKDAATDALRDLGLDDYNK